MQFTAARSGTGASFAHFIVRKFRSRRSGALFIAVALLLSGCLFPSRGALFVTLSVEGHSAHVPGPQTVAGMLRETHLSPGPGVLYSAATHRVLARSWSLTPTVRVDGRPASLGTTVRGGSQVQVERSQSVEPIEMAYVQASTPFGRGRVAKAIDPNNPPADWTGALEQDRLWRPGRPALRRVKLGSVSGEQLANLGTVPGVPPAPDTRKHVAVSIDDGPTAQFTPQILRILQQQNVRATFCLIGGPPNAGPQEGSISAHPDLVRAEAAQGDTLCDHTMDHDEHLDQKPPASIASDIGGDRQLIEQTTGVAPSFFRPPGGTRSGTIVQTVKAQGMRVLYWTIDTEDYKQRPAAQQLQTVLGQVQPGAIILMHDGGGDRTQTVAMLPQLIQTLRQQGYGFTTPGQERPPSLPPLQQPGAAHTTRENGV